MKNKVVSLSQLVAWLRTALVEEITNQSARSFINARIGNTGRQLYGASIVEGAVIVNTATACKIHSVVPPS